MNLLRRSHGGLPGTAPLACACGADPDDFVGQELCSGGSRFGSRRSGAVCRRRSSTGRRAAGRRRPRGESPLDGSRLRVLRRGRAIEDVREVIASARERRPHGQRRSSSRRDPPLQTMPACATAAVRRGGTVDADRRDYENPTSSQLALSASGRLRVEPLSTRTLSVIVRPECRYRRGVPDDLVDNIGAAREVRTQRAQHLEPPGARLGRGFPSPRIREARPASGRSSTQGRDAH